MDLLQNKNTDFDAVYDRYADMLYRLALSHLRSISDAEDVLQEVFLKYLRASAFHDEAHRRAWLIRVTINHCRDFLRRSSRRTDLPLDEAENCRAPENADLPDIFSILAALPPKYKDVMVFHYLEGYSIQETAQALQLSVSAVKMRLSRGRKMVYQSLKKEEEYVFEGTN